MMHPKDERNIFGILERNRKLFLRPRCWSHSPADLAQLVHRLSSVALIAQITARNNRGLQFRDVYRFSQDARLVGRGGINLRERLRLRQLRVPLVRNCGGGFDKFVLGNAGRAFGDDGSARGANAAGFHDRLDCIHVGFLFYFCRLAHSRQQRLPGRFVQQVVKRGGPVWKPLGIGAADGRNAKPLAFGSSVTAFANMVGDDPRCIDALWL